MGRSYTELSTGYKDEIVFGSGLVSVIIRLPCNDRWLWRFYGLKITPKAIWLILKVGGLRIIILDLGFARMIHTNIVWE